MPQSRKERARVAATLGQSLLAAGFALGISVSAAAGDLLRVSGVWAPPTVPGQSVGAVYLQLRSAQEAALVGIETDAAATAEIHHMTMESDVMRMRRLDVLELPAGQSVELAPGAQHVMLVGLRHPLKVGDSVKLTLMVRLRNGGTIREAVVAPVVQKAGHGSHR